MINLRDVPKIIVPCLGWYDPWCGQIDPELSHDMYNIHRFMCDSWASKSDFSCYHTDVGGGFNS